VKLADAHPLPVSPETAYSVLQDPVVLAKCIPGCEALDKTGDNDYRIRLKMVLASISGLFDGKIRIADPNPPTSFRLIVEASGKIGFVNGDGLLTLSPCSSATTVQFDGEVHLGGTIASVGQRLLNTTAKMLIKRFFKKLADVCENFGDNRPSSSA
jgi:carbon monoxide dehydrogenase subunit G